VAFPGLEISLVLLAANFLGTACGITSIRPSGGRLWFPPGTPAGLVRPDAEVPSRL